MGELEALRAENEALKLRVAWLEGEVGLSATLAERDACRQVLGVSRVQAYLLCRLAKAFPRPVQRWALEESWPTGRSDFESNNLTSHVSHLRRCLGREAIVTAETGYRIGEAMCARVRAAMATAQPSALEAA